MATAQEIIENLIPEDRIPRTGPDFVNRIRTHEPVGPTQPPAKNKRATSKPPTPAEVVGRRS